MTLEEAKKLLGESEVYADFDKEPNYVVLDGYFGLEELEACLLILRSKKNSKTFSP